MPSTDLPIPDARRLLASWWELTRFVLYALTAEVHTSTDQAVNRVRDAILDLGDDPEGGDGKAFDAQPLPPLPPRQLIEALRPHVEAALRRTVEVINEDSYGCWARLTEERVAALFQELAQVALDEAFELRVAAAEARCAPQQTLQGWARRYRRMMAREGRWPPPGR
jgi:hypothetical protein